MFFFRLESQWNIIVLILYRNRNAYVSPATGFSSLWPGIGQEKRKKQFVHYSERRIIAIDLEMIESLTKTICECDFCFVFARWIY